MLKSGREIIDRQCREGNFRQREQHVQRHEVKFEMASLSKMESSLMDPKSRGCVVGDICY